MTSCIVRSVAKAFSISLSRSTLFVSRKLAGSRWLLQVEHKEQKNVLRMHQLFCTCGKKFGAARAT